MDGTPGHETWDEHEHEHGGLKLVHSPASNSPGASIGQASASASSRGNGRRGSTEPAKQLACASCRRKKIKCQPSPGDSVKCQGCTRSGTECIVPFVDERKLSVSKKLVRELYEKIASLEAEVDELRAVGMARPSRVARTGVSRVDILRSCVAKVDALADQGRRRASPAMPLIPGVPGNPALCSLSRGPMATPEGMRWQMVLSKTVEDRLLDIFWQHHNGVTPIIYKAAFLQDYRSGRERYCSRLLVHCMLARAASIDDDARASVPELLPACEVLLKQELTEPTTTTLQSLLVLADAHEGRPDDKEYLYLAICLAYRSGMAESMQGGSLAETVSSEHEIREICFSSCYLLDWQWSLYTGKPLLVERKRPPPIPPSSAPGVSAERRLLMVWTGLIEISKVLLEAIGGAQASEHKVRSMSHALRTWYMCLHPEYDYVPSSPPRPGVFHLHMQYSTTVILLYRPFAGFDDPQDTADSALLDRPRLVCMQHACLISQYLQQYRDTHGGWQKLSWTSLHPMCTAATTLIAGLAKGVPGTDSAVLWACLATCIRALKELSQSHAPAASDRHMLVEAVDLLNLKQRSSTVAGSTPLQELHTIPTESMWDGDKEAVVRPLSTGAGDFMPPNSQGSLADLRASFAALCS